MANTRQPEHQRCGEALAKRLAELAQDLIFDDFGTEGTGARLQPVHQVASLAALTPASLAATLGPGPEHRAYIVGIAPDGDLVGLETRVIWT